MHTKLILYLELIAKTVSGPAVSDSISGGRHNYGEEKGNDKINYIKK